MDGAPCQPITVIFARGTTGNNGFDNGPALRTVRRERVDNKVNYLGVGYEASVTVSHFLTSFVRIFALRLMMMVVR